MFHSLGKQSQNIHALRGDLSPSPLAELRERLENLKVPGLWDEESDLWIRSNSNPECYPLEQLLSVLVETHFSKGAAAARHAVLKEYGYAAEEYEWNDSLSEGESTLRYIQPILLEVMVNVCVGDFLAARKHWTALQTGPFWDAELNVWRSWCHSRDGWTSDPLIYSKDQLAGIFALNLFDPYEAEARFLCLKKGPLWDQEKSLWRDVCNTSFSGGWAETPSTEDQLWGVLVQALFDPCEAKGLLQRLKQTPAWNHVNSRWNFSLSSGHMLRDYECQTADQLLGLLVELGLAEYDAREASKPIDLPRLKNARSAN